MDWLALAFMQRALLAALITGVTAPAIGTYLVQRRLSLLGDGLGHLAVAGVGLAILTGTAPLPLAIGQPVTVVVQSKERIQGIVLPAQAVVRNPSNEPIVWIKSGAERFIPQPVQFRPLDASTVVVTQGLSADNRVVVQGAPLIAQIR